MDIARLSQFQETLSQYRTHFDSWKDETFATIDSQKREAHNNAAKGSIQVAQLKAAEKSYNSRCTSLDNDLEVERMKIVDLERVISDLENKIETFPLQKEELLIELEKENVTLRDYRKALASLEADKRYRLNELTKGQSYYETRLGLKFERIENDWLRIVYTQIDKSNPSREFWFSVRVDDANKYHVMAIDPQVGGTTALLEKLNESNDFSAFIKNMRKKFVEYKDL